MGKKDKRKNSPVEADEQIERSTTEDRQSERKKKKKRKVKVATQEEEEEVLVCEEIAKATEAQANDDNDSCHLSEESDIDLEDSDELRKRMRKISKRQLPTWDLEDVEYPKSSGRTPAQNVLSNHPLHQLFPRICNITADEAAQIKRNKINWIRGKFIEKENETLKRNWEKYLEEHHIPNAALLFGMFRRGKSIDSKLKDYYSLYFKSSKLMLRLAKDLPNRRLQQIYHRARALFVGLKQGSDFTEEDQQLILKLHRLHGEKYALFCEKYGFNPKAAREFIRNIETNAGVSYKRGTWTDAEMNKLCKTVKKFMQDGDLKSYDKISWTDISTKMNRSDVQCRNKFYSKAVFMMLSKENNTDWDKKMDFAKFITLLKKMEFEDELQIDWDFVNQVFGVQLFNVLHSSWRTCKSKVPDVDKKSLSEIIDHIYSLKVEKPFGHREEKMQLINDFIDKVLD